MLTFSTEGVERPDVPAPVEDSRTLKSFLHVFIEKALLDALSQFLGTSGKIWKLDGSTCDVSEMREVGCGM